MSEAPESGLTERLEQAKQYLRFENWGESADAVHEAMQRINELEQQLKQAYIDGGCTEDEASEMVEGTR